MAKLELFGAARCPHTQEMREWLEWKRSDFIEYDVEADHEARRRMSAVAPGSPSRDGAYFIESAALDFLRGEAAVS